MGKDEDATRQARSRERMAPVDYLAGPRIDAAPEAERLVRDERLASPSARHHNPTDELARYASHGPSSTTVRPATAEATQSSVEAKTARTPMMPGA